jgi:hypothetical protein
MKTLAPWLVPLAALPCVALAQSTATSIVLNFTDTVAPAQQHAYEEGIKAYNQCLSQHGFKFKWTAWLHVTGDVGQYSYDTDPVMWADFDAMHAADRACDEANATLVNPHVMRTTSEFLMVTPELSYLPDNTVGTGLLEVSHLTLKFGPKAHDTFVNMAKMIIAAAHKANWANHFAILEVNDAGAGAPDFLVVEPAKDWTEVGQLMSNPPLWKMVEGVYGKSKADAMRAAVDEALVSESSQYERYSADLSYTPPTH